MVDPSYSSTPIGWREWVNLPSIGIPWVKAKIDTGAQTSALHATGIEEFERDGAPWVRFLAHPWQRADSDEVAVELPIHDRRIVRSSSGHAQERPVVLIDIKIAGRTVPAEVTLTDREEMVFRMLIGREALRRGYLVDSASSFLGGKPKRAIRRRNRGRE
ncbi:ATP-dependent zinc protease [Leucobacter sp. CSA2]|uniref:ATP-dependent zinc protease n=1 Tax=Leucobacter edaphi TaxID=2796472 RepID=A0A934UYB0_9MICO|nr:ATP-dependent zinc protease [Leucobacter edaphi]MBK0422283.1 ATP-dependent zinc protease [Leucobacter edaphi]